MREQFCSFKIFQRYFEHWLVSCPNLGYCFSSYKPALSFCATWSLTCPITNIIKTENTKVLLTDIWSFHRILLFKRMSVQGSENNSMLHVIFFFAKKIAWFLYLMDYWIYEWIIHYVLLDYLKKLVLWHLWKVYRIWIFLQPTVKYSQRTKLGQICWLH